MIVTCQTCGRKNRVPLSRLGTVGTCGACKTQLPALAAPLDVGPDEFREIVNSTKVPVLVDFWAEWCGPCRMAAPEVKKVAEELAGQAVVLKVNTQLHPGLAQMFNVQGIPNFAVLQNGEVVRQQPGLVDHRQLRRWLEDAARNSRSASRTES